MPLMTTGAGVYAATGGGGGGTTTFDPNPANAVTGMVFSGGNLVATLGGTAGVGRSITSHSSGKFYAEFVPTTASNLNNCEIGIINASGALNSFLGGDNNALGWAATGAFFNSFAQVGMIQTYALGDTLCMAADFGNSKIWFRANGGNWNNDVLANQNPATNTGGFSISTLAAGPYFAASSMNASGDQFTANFGATAYAQSVPAGFGNW